MAVKIRLQRRGRKKKPFYWIVAADIRAKRDGKFLEKIGTYNPIPEIHEINVNIELAVKWLQNGALPTTTAKRLLSKEGALLRNHLEIGVVKGAITKEEAEKKFKAWLTDKEKKEEQNLDKRKKEAEKKLKAKQEEAKKKSQEKLEEEKKAQEEAIAESASGNESEGNQDSTTTEPTSSSDDEVQETQAVPSPENTDQPQPESKQEQAKTEDASS